MSEELIFKSFSEFKKYCFPKQYQKEQEEIRIKEIGFGKYLAEIFIEEMKRDLKLKIKRLESN